MPEAVQVNQPKVWIPKRRQEVFLSLPDDIFEALFGGAAGPGKTESLMMLPIVRGFVNHPRFKGLVLRRTYPELERELIPRSKEYYAPLGAKYNDQKHCWFFPSNASIWFGHAESEQDIEKYDTAEFNYIGFDELTSFTMYQYLYLAVERCRSSTNELPAIVRAGSNPGKIGHTWVKNRFIDPAPWGTVIRDKTSKQLRIFIEARLEDNDSLDTGYASRLELLKYTQPEEYQAKRWGNWDIFEGQYFEFREQHVSGEPENAVHTYEPFNIPSWWPIIVSVDWGYAAATWFGFAAISPSRRVYLFKEYCQKNVKIADWCTELKRQAQGLNVIGAVICKSAQQNRGEEKSIFELVREYTGINFKLADNSRVSGAQLLRDYLRWLPIADLYQNKESYNNERAAWILRNRGLDSYNEYLASFVEKPTEDNLPKLQISKDCTNVITAMKSAVYDDKNKEDVAEFIGDDPYDGVRYLIKEADFYLNSAEEELNKRKALSDILEQQEKKPDWNRFYMQMRLQESPHYQKRFGISRHRHVQRVH